MTAHFEEAGSPAWGARGPQRYPGRRPRRRVVVVGSDAAVVALTRRLRAEPLAALTVVGACVPEPASSAELVVEGIPLGRMDDVLRVLDDVQADAVLAAGPHVDSGTYVRELIRRLHGSGRDVLVAADDVEPTDRIAKAVVDRVCAAVLLLVSAVLLALIAVVIRVESPGGVLTRSRRLGRWGGEFDLLRFRTTAADGSAFRAGQFLRSSGLDRLPELVNVLVGNMSLVGPRPQPVPGTAPGDAVAEPWLPVRPGMIGLWHLPAGPADQDGPVGLEYYRRNWSLALDLRIIVRALGAAVRQRRTR
jgi:lipopolysaccharide/colanic/teichoic acid biosynthesis glycosyltransferase